MDYWIYILLDDLYYNNFLFLLEKYISYKLQIKESGDTFKIYPWSKSIHLNSRAAYQSRVRVKGSRDTKKKIKKIKNYIKTNNK